MEHNKISIIIVTFNNEDTISDCLKSITKYSPGHEIIVVDNDSQDQTRQIIKKNFPDVKLIESGTNLGFGKGNHLAINYITGDILIFLNPDTCLFQPETLEKLVNILIKNPKYGLIGPQLVYPDRKIQLTVRNLPTLENAVKEYWLGFKGAYDFYLPQGTNLVSVESVVGACMVIEKDLFEKIGGFSDKYFMYFEDLELCKSLKMLGYKIGYVPDIKIEHAVGVSGKKQQVSVLLIQSAKKYHGVLTYYLIQLILTPRRIVNKIKAIL